jgi:hypothetical protein
LGFGFRVLGFGSWVLGFGYWALGFGFWVKKGLWGVCSTTADADWLSGAELAHAVQ